MKANIFDVAKKSGLSTVTVSRVLNNAPTVREKNRQKVLEAIKELNYSPSSAARTLKHGRTGVIGLTLTALNDSVFDGVVKSVFDHSQRSGYFLAISIASEASDDTGEASNFLFQEDRVDGIIVLSSLEEERYISELKKKRIPFVVVDSHQEHVYVPTVNVNNYRGGYEATKHLISLGHTDIAHISGQDTFLSASERRKGFTDAMTQAGLSPAKIAVGSFGIHCGYDIMKQWIASGQTPTAVFAADDVIALGAMRALMEAKFRVPEDVSVIGYDDQLFADEVYPKLTTMRQPVEELGEHAVQILLEQMSEPQDAQHKRTTKILLEPKLVVRESTSFKR
ncbi:LacI family transcriptional regulator [Paenibacillaceae bacterium]|nr:LacI family transcriptional regulator [Paenibacillaceae bacterium]